MKHQIVKVFFLISLFFIGCTSNAVMNTVVTDKDEILCQILNKADQNTLVILDCDDVLITPSSDYNEDEAFEYLSDKLDLSQIQKILFDLHEQRGVRLVNEDLPQIIKSLQNKETKVLVLTSHWTGKFRNFGYFEDFRKNELKSVGFDFKGPWNTVNKITFYSLPSSMPSEEIIRYPVFDDGILFSCNFKKTTVLQKFLEQIQQKFRKIIFVDDRDRNIQTMKSFCETNGISGYCVHYTKAKSLTKKTIKFQELKEKLDKIISQYQ